MIKKNDVLKSKMSSQGKVPHEVQIIETESDNIYFRSLDNGSVYCLTLSELERDYVIPKESDWQPKENEPVYIITANGMTSRVLYHLELKPYIDFLGGYRTEDEAEQALAEIKEKLKNNI